MNAKHPVDTLLTATSKALQLCCAVIMGFLLVAVVVQVFARYVLNNPTSWSESMSQIAFIWLTVFGCAVVMRDREALSVDLLQNHLKGAPFLIVQILCDFICVVVCVYWLRSCILQVGNTWEIMEGGLRIRRGIIYIGISVAFAFMILYEVVNLISGVRTLFTGGGGKPRQTEKEVSN